MVAVDVGISRNTITEPVGVAFSGLFVPPTFLSEGLLEDAVFVARRDHDKAISQSRNFILQCGDARFRRAQ